jgi:hypothetical protein
MLWVASVHSKSAAGPPTQPDCCRKTCLTSLILEPALSGAVLSSSTHPQPTLSKPDSTTMHLTTEAIPGLRIRAAFALAKVTRQIDRDVGVLDIELATRAAWRLGYVSPGATRAPSLFAQEPELENAFARGAAERVIDEQVDDTRIAHEVATFELSLVLDALAKPTMPRHPRTLVIGNAQRALAAHELRHRTRLHITLDTEYGATDELWDFGILDDNDTARGFWSYIFDKYWKSKSAESWNLVWVDTTDLYQHPRHWANAANYEDDEWDQSMMRVKTARLVAPGGALIVRDISWDGAEAAIEAHCEYRSLLSSEELAAHLEQYFVPADCLMKGWHIFVRNNVDVPAYRFR